MWIHAWHLSATVITKGGPRSLGVLGGVELKDRSGDGRVRGQQEQRPIGREPGDMNRAGRAGPCGPC